MQIGVVIQESETYYALSILQENVSQLYGTNGIMALLSAKKSQELIESSRSEGLEEMKLVNSQESLSHRLQEVWEKIRLELFLKTIVVELGEDSVDMGRDKLVTLVGDNLSVDFIQRSDNSMLCGVKLARLALQDERKSVDNLFR